jgi:hypothetical protein
LNFRLFFLVILICVSNAQAQAFDAEVWKTGLDKTVSSRLHLFQEFLQERGLIGKSRADVISVLGPGINETGLLKYQLSRTDCEASSRVVSIKFNSDDKAEAWSIGTMAPTQIAPLWNDTNKEKLPVKSGYKLLFPSLTNGESSSLN